MSEPYRELHVDLNRRTDATRGEALRRVQDRAQSIRDIAKDGMG